MPCLSMTNPFTRLLRLRIASAWIALLAVALAPLAQAMRAPAQAIDVPYCDAGAHANARTHRGPAPARGHIVLYFSAAAVGSPAQPHTFLPSPPAALPIVATTGTAPIAAPRLLRATPRVWTRPLGRAPPVTAPVLA